ncbi:DUF736 domain-containing protein [Paracoccus aminovorans]|uniref:DUF736 domain-containing protein n=1 Tax=Paracoccus aminovorans TaxID=34004 RepID=UPI002B25D3C5|nr:DUF736 domain-containing protein [Paracoccus aminovorans]
MATIGTFTKNENGAGFTGAVKTLTLNVKAKFTATEGDSERGPDFRIVAGATEFGAAWKKIARKTQREYLSVKLDDPSFPAPIYANRPQVVRIVRTNPTQAAAQPVSATTGGSSS